MKAANVNVESYWPGLFAKALEGVNVKELITNIGSGVGAAPAGAGGMYIILSVTNVFNYSTIFMICKTARLSRYSIIL